MHAWEPRTGLTWASLSCGPMSGKGKGEKGEKPLAASVCEDGMQLSQADTHVKSRACLNLVGFCGSRIAPLGCRTGLMSSR